MIHLWLSTILGNSTDEDTPIDIGVVINDSDLDGTLDLNFNHHNFSCC